MEVSIEKVKLAGKLLKEEREKVLELEKQASNYSTVERATKLAFKEVELGLAPAFQSYEEFQTKVASLAEENLDILEMALNRGYGTVSFSGVELAGDDDGLNKEARTGQELFSNFLNYGKLK